MGEGCWATVNIHYHRREFFQEAACVVGIRRRIVCRQDGISRVGIDEGAFGMWGISASNITLEGRA